MKQVVWSLIVAASALSAAGCSVAMAAHQPSKKDVKLFAQGMPRSMVVAEVGAPVSSEMNAGKRVEVYAFTQGYSKGARVGRTIGHGTADVLTLAYGKSSAPPRRRSSTAAASRTK